MGFRIDYGLVCLVGCRSRGRGGGHEKGQNDKAQKAQAGPRGGRHSRASEARRGGRRVMVGGWSVSVSVSVSVSPSVSVSECRCVCCAEAQRRGALGRAAEQQPTVRAIIWSGWVFIYYLMCTVYSSTNQPAANQYLSSVMMTRSHPASVSLIANSNSPPGPPPQNLSLPTSRFSRYKSDIAISSLAVHPNYLFIPTRTRTRKCIR